MLNLDLYTNSNFYDEPEWMTWDMPEYDAPVPKEYIEDKIWPIRKVCGFCGKPIIYRFTYCGLHAKLFKKPEVKITKRHVKR